MEQGNQAGHSATGTSTVFISYSRGDRARALPIIKILEDAGFDVWWDGLLEGGERFAHITEAALARAKAVVVLWSATSYQSHWVHDEATVGRDRNCLVPLSIDGAEPPLGFRQFQIIDAAPVRVKAGSAEMRQMLRAVAALHDRPDDFTIPAVAPTAGPSRRALLIGGGAVGLVGSGLAAWLTGLIGGRSASATSIAVLPFDNLSEDKQQTYFSDGLAAEIRAQLTRNELLQVAAQASSNLFREDKKTDARTISRKLGVAYFLDGEVQRAGDLVKVSVQLIDGQKGSNKWGESFERPLINVFEVQNEIAAQVASALSAEIDPAKRKTSGEKALGGTKSVAAFDAYLRGRELYDAGIDENNDRQALAKFDEAIAEDANYAAAHAGRSRALAVIANLYAGGAERRALFADAVSASKRAVELAPDYAEAHSALGFAIAFGQLNMKAARGPYEKSVQLGKGDADVLSRYAVFRSRFGEFEAANAAILQSSALDPLNPRTFRSIGDINYGARRYDEAIAAYSKALELNPKLSGAKASIGFALFAQGRVDEAATYFAEEPSKIRKLTGQALVANRLGKRPEAERILAEMIAEYGDESEYQYAQVYAQWGEQAKALVALQRARSHDDSGLVMMQNDPLLDPVRKAPEFSGLLKSVGFV
jgi:TolB-like protein/Tfp pilus assembly protein PilF